MTRRIVCVLGVGRSGTSLVCQILNALGVYFGEPGELLAASPNNERGHYEHAGINGVLNGCLAANGMTWLTSSAVPDSWFTSVSATQARSFIADRLCDLQSQFDGMTLGFKNPRSVLLMPLIQSAFVAAKLEPIYIRCLRDPRDVHASIKRVGDPESANLTLREVYAIWSRYYIASQAVDALDVWYEDWFDYTQAPVKRLGEYVGASGESQRFDAIVRDRNIVDPDLRHSWSDAR